MYLFYCRWPLCIHGNSCLLGSTTGNLTMPEQTGIRSLSLWETYIHFCRLLTTLVDLCSLPNDINETRKWSCGTARQVSLRVCNLDIKPGLISKALSILLIHPSCMYPFYCLWPLCIHGNSCLLGSTTGNPTMVEQTGSWLLLLWETYINLCHLLTNESWDSIWIVSLVLGWHKPF